MSDNKWDFLLRHIHLHNAAEFERSLNLGDFVKNKAPLGIVKKAENVIRSFKRDDIHEAGRVADVGANLAIDPDQLLHANGLYFLHVNGVLEPVPQNQH